MEYDQHIEVMYHKVIMMVYTDQMNNLSRTSLSICQGRLPFYYHDGKNCDCVIVLYYCEVFCNINADESQLCFYIQFESSSHNNLSSYPILLITIMTL